ncbi:MAG: type I-G CRISPR-associated protein, Cas3-extension family [Candidatus Dormibacteria bacterium]
MTQKVPCPGLSANWLNAWLAAIGVTVLVPNVRLAWSPDPIPSALFCVPDDLLPLAHAVAEALPTDANLRASSIARAGTDEYPEFPRRVDLPAFAARARLERRRHDGFLSASVTDLKDPLPPDGLPHSPLDPPMPRGVTLWERALSCRRDLNDPVEDISRTLQGQGRRVSNNGLGFDIRRLSAGTSSGDTRVDPALELLAFHALPLFPIRGDGRRDATRAWSGSPTRVGALTWCAWSQPLDRWGIDALLDLLPQAMRDPRLAARLGLFSWFHSVPYQPSGTSDTTRAYASNRISEPARSNRRPLPGPVGDLAPPRSSERRFDGGVPPRPQRGSRPRTSR